MTPDDAAIAEYIAAINQAVARSAQLAAALADEQNKTADLTKQIATMKNTPPAP